mgnify:CR=1 FL=1
MYAALTIYVQAALVCSALVAGTLMAGPYIIQPLRRWACPHRGDVVVLKRSRYEAMLNALEALRVENAQQQELLMKRRLEPVASPDEDEQTIARLEEWLRKQGAR